MSIRTSSAGLRPERLLDRIRTERNRRADQGGTGGAKTLSELFGARRSTGRGASYSARSIAGLRGRKPR